MSLPQYDYVSLPDMIMCHCPARPGNLAQDSRIKYGNDTLVTPDNDKIC